MNALKMAAILLNPIIIFTDGTYPQLAGFFTLKEGD
jgi:hypothetical protein